MSDGVDEGRYQPSVDGSELHRLVLVAGDTHGNYEHFESLFDVAKREGCDRIVQVGDFGYWPHISDFAEKIAALASWHGIDVYWLDGNHENFDALQEDIDFESDMPQLMYDGEDGVGRLWYLPRGCTWEWEGCRFMALGGAYSIDKAYRTEGVSWWPQELLTTPQVERAMSRGPVDILLTHDAPEGFCPIISTSYKGDEISRGNRLAISAVVEAARPRLLVHGHYHHRYTDDSTATLIEGLGRDDQGRDSWLIVAPAMWAASEAAMQL